MLVLLLWDTFVSANTSCIINGAARDDHPCQGHSLGAVLVCGDRPCLGALPLSGYQFREVGPPLPFLESFTLAITGIGALIRLYWIYRRD